jgi:enoyl-[acyl-carrier-protein] reductase (NADH)
MAPGSEVTAANVSRKSTEVANVVVHYLSPGSGDVTGTTWAVDGGNMYSGSIRWKGT